MCKDVQSLVRHSGNGIIQPSMPDITGYYIGCNKSRTHWELQTVYEMAEIYVQYALSGKDTPAPHSSITMTEDEYSAQADKLFGI